MARAFRLFAILGAGLGFGCRRVCAALAAVLCFAVGGGLAEAGKGGRAIWVGEFGITVPAQGRGDVWVKGPISGTLRSCLTAVGKAGEASVGAAAPTAMAARYSRMHPSSQMSCATNAQASRRDLDRTAFVYGPRAPPALCV
jgi:hypothetical protein